MDQIKAFEFIERKKDFLFPNDEYSGRQIQAALLAAPDSFAYTMDAIPFRKPSTVKLISIFPGSLGVDRFYLGDIKMGILKYITFGGFFVWWIKDIKSAEQRCRAYNCRKLLEAINDPSVVDSMRSTDETLAKARTLAKSAAPVLKEAAKGAKRVGKTFEID